VYGHPAYDGDAVNYEASVIHDRVRSYLLSLDGVMRHDSSTLQPSIEETASWPIH
jgi:hypothetical protein